MKDAPQIRAWSSETPSSAPSSAERFQKVSEMPRFSAAVREKRYYKIFSEVVVDCASSENLSRRSVPWWMFDSISRSSR
jgi:hypothetical protein